MAYSPPRIGRTVGTLAAGNDPRFAARSIREWGTVGVGSDDSLLVAQACTDLRGTGAAIHVPSDCRLLMGPAARLAGNAPVLDGVGLIADGTRDSGVPYGARGGTLLLTDTGGPAFVCKRGWTLEGMTFFWPGQVEDGSAPRVFPPLLTGAGTGQGGANEDTEGRFENCDVVNAYVVADFAADVCGGLQVHRNRMFFLKAGFRLSTMPLESFFSNNQFTPNAYGNLAMAGPTYRLRDQAAQQAAAFEIVGNGTAQARSTQSVDGLILTSNYVFGMAYGIRIMGGTLDVSALTGNSFDGVGRVMSVETGGLVSGVRIAGGIWYPYTFGSPATVTPAIYSAPDAAPGCNLHVGAVSAPSCVGDLVDWNAPVSTLTMSDVEAPGCNNLSGGAGTATGIKFSSLGGRLSVVGGTIVMQGTAPGVGIAVMQPPQSLTVLGVQFVSCAAPISLDGGYASACMTIAGNTSTGTHGASAYAGTQAAALPDIGNSWDKPTPGWSQGRRGSDGALTFAFGGTVQAALLPNGTLRTAGAVVTSTTP